MLGGRRMPAASSWNWLKVERETVLRVKASATSDRGRHGAGVGGGGDLGVGARRSHPRTLGQGRREASGQEGAGAAGREGLRQPCGFSRTVAPVASECDLRVSSWMVGGTRGKSGLWTAVGAARPGGRAVGWSSG